MVRIQRWIVTAAAVLVMFVSACQSGAERTKDSSSLACNHFRNIARDIRDGVLTPDEARTKFKQVDDDASIATPEVRQAARHLLSAYTQADLTGVRSAVSEMDSACSEAGH